MDDSKKNEYDVKLYEFIQKLNYPIKTSDVIEAGKKEGFDPNTLARIEQIPEGEYFDPVELTDELGQVEIM
jgi:hypothetical protein